MSDVLLLYSDVLICVLIFNIVEMHIDKLIPRRLHCLIIVYRRLISITLMLNFIFIKYTVNISTCLNNYLDFKISLLRTLLFGIII